MIVGGPASTRSTGTRATGTAPTRLFRVRKDGSRNSQQPRALSADEPTRNTPLGQCASNKNNAYERKYLSCVYFLVVVAGSKRAAAPAVPSGIQPSDQHQEFKMQERRISGAPCSVQSAGELRPARARALVPPAWPSRVHVVRGTPGRDADMDADRSPNRPPTAMPGAGAPRVSRRRLDQSAWKSQRLLRLDV